MAQSPKKRIRHGLADDKRPIVLNKQDGSRLVAQTELAQLQDKREKLQAQLEEFDDQILELKNRRKEELLAELKSLGLDVVPATKAKASTNDGKRKGRPSGFKMSEAQKKAMREGREKAKAAREGKAAEAELPLNP